MVRYSGQRKEPERDKLVITERRKVNGKGGDCGSCCAGLHFFVRVEGARTLFLIFWASTRTEITLSSVR
jgi:hypothetical protein